AILRDRRDGFQRRRVPRRGGRGPALWDAARPGSDPGPLRPLRRGSVPFRLKNERRPVFTRRLSGVDETRYQLRPRPPPPPPKPRPPPSVLGLASFTVIARPRTSWRFRALIAA